ncbi:unnamed protein product [Rotaria socialis]|uniref:Rad50/SbcC-type AAA domain-containing protein n=1 Tax=Rotaria socialis TaxID=392032 RepID=A0A821DGT3_9BILA|nr:unnamed protein product [Rotaria socialis]CAF3619494.1 unnamed protein product [Rotaria socialis]CAF4621340.1 unnamed protein product [Rotaria socialis]CAF4725591.1 unnamed protein product [Rotaria socialis]
MMETHKRPVASNSDMNNNDIIHLSKKKSILDTMKKSFSVGQIKELHMLNFMCHKYFSIQFHPTHMQIVTGVNGSGKSTIANAVCLCLGAQARTTGRTSNVQSFIRKGETSAQLTIILANEGPEAYKPEVYGKEIQIIRRIGSRKSGYKILGANHRIMSTRKETIDEIIQALSISPENPLCVLHQEVAKTFLISSDSTKKYQFYMKVSQLDQIKQAYEQGVCTVRLLTQRVNTMKEKHVEMLRRLEPLEQEVKKIELRRNYEEKRHLLEVELIAARADQARQELLEVHNNLDQVQSTKDDIDAQTIENNNKIYEIDQIVANYLIEKNDFEKDTYGLNELLSYFSKQKQKIQHSIHRHRQDREDYRKVLTEIELEQIYLQKQMDKYENLNHQSDDIDQQRLEIDREISTEQEKQIELDKIMIALNNDMRANNENILQKQTTMDFLKDELKQRQQNLDELIKINQDRTKVYGTWMSDCLKSIQNDERFHKKPLGPIGNYVHCIDSHWSYAIEKHLASIMSSFICSDNHDEAILLEILSSYAFDCRPPIYIRAYSSKVHDISGTLKRIRAVNLLPIYDVLKIDNITVECALIDIKQIEATILIENLEPVKELRQNKILRWERIDGKVKQVVEAWTFDGTNIKFDKTFRIYTNEKQPIKYFLTNNIQSLSMEELEVDIKLSYSQIEDINSSMQELKGTRQTIADAMNQTNISIANNKTKINELMKKLDHLNGIMPIIVDCSLSDLQEKAKSYLITYTETVRKYDEAKEKEDEHVRQIADLTENYENTIKKIDFKTHQYDLLIESINAQQSNRYEIKQKLKNLKKKSTETNARIRECKNLLKQLTKQQSKKPKITAIITRCVRDIQNELDAINNYIRANEDTYEKRREIINKYRTERDAAKEYKQTYERCYQQIEYLKQFINKRQEGFLTIAEQHQYYLRIKFQNLMKTYYFDDCDIKIDHKKEQLELIIKKDQRHPALLSGGERSISTFCFLLALWQSIYQPFRLLDEIDIYMDNEKRNSSLEILYQNSLYYSSSQHIIFTPQAIDFQYWNKLNVPVFNMPTPKRYNQEID